MSIRFEARSCHIVYSLLSSVSVDSSNFLPRATRRTRGESLAKPTEPDGDSCSCIIEFFITRTTSSCVVSFPTRAPSFRLRRMRSTIHAYLVAPPSPTHSSQPADGPIKRAHCGCARSSLSPPPTATTQSRASSPTFPQGPRKGPPPAPSHAPRHRLTPRRRRRRSGRSGAVALFDSRAARPPRDDTARPPAPTRSSRAAARRRAAPPAVPVPP